MHKILLLLSLVAVTLVVAGCASSDSISDRQYGQQYICHKDRTLAVSTADMFVHQNHGDSLGPCPGDH